MKLSTEKQDRLHHMMKHLSELGVNVKRTKSRLEIFKSIQSDIISTPKVK